MDVHDLVRQTKVEGVQLQLKGHKSSTKTGTLLFFSNEFLFTTEENEILQFLYKNIDSVQRNSDRDVIVVFKTFLIMKLTTLSPMDCYNVSQALVNLSNLDDPLQFYAFVYKPEYQVVVDASNPFAEAPYWQLYDVDEQFKRMGISPLEWRITGLNKDFKFCDSYPKRFIVPKDVDEFLLEAVARFRCRRRIPVLSYFYQARRSFLIRCGQPMVGPRRTSCIEDEKLYALFLRLNPQRQIIILDGRTPEAANFSFSKGYGFEQPPGYVNARVSFAKLEHAYLLREFQNKLLDAVRSHDVGVSTWLTETAGWFSQVQICISTAILIARIVGTEGTSLIFHCEDDSDTAPIFLSLGKLLLDPYYRTFQGFQVLIEEEWVAFGFRFATRCGQLRDPKAMGVNQQAPYFSLFLDCVFQLLEQDYGAFEFNQNFLFSLFENANSCRFGTFMYDTVQEREYYGVPAKTQSYWACCNSAKYKPRFLNRFYKPFSAIKEVSPDSRSVKFWEGFYNPWVRGSLTQSSSDPTQNPDDLDDLEAKLRELRATEASLAEQASKAKASNSSSISYDAHSDPLGANLLS